MHGMPGDWWTMQAGTRRESDKLACVATDIINCSQPSNAKRCCLCAIVLVTSQFNSAELTSD